MIKLPKTLPIPAPDPATPTVAAPAPMNLAAESMSLRIAVVCIGWTANLLLNKGLAPIVGLATVKIGACDVVPSDLVLRADDEFKPVTIAGLKQARDPLTSSDLMIGATMFAFDEKDISNLIWYCNNKDKGDKW